MAETGAKGPYTKEATAWVMENREALGIPTVPTHGYCGLGKWPAHTIRTTTGRASI